MKQPREETTLPKRPPMTSAATNVDEYLAALPDDQRRVLSRLRSQIRAIAPEAIESISYGLPTYKLDGRPVAYFGSAKGHVSLYAVGVMDARGKPIAELKKYDTSGRGTVRFPPDKPIPARIVTKIVKANVARIRSRASTRTRVRSSDG
jgi:uncharacterized protein YdhG (YjbR/CyaY superfamily)